MEQQRLYKFQNRRIGLPSWDWHTFILFRSKNQIVRKYKAWGLSTAILMDLIKKGCKLVIIQVDGEAKYKISPKDWLEKSIVGTLYQGQEPHAFMPINLFQKIGE